MVQDVTQHVAWFFLTISPSMYTQILHGVNRWPNTVIIAKWFCKNPYLCIIKGKQTYVKLESQNMSFVSRNCWDIKFLPWMLSLLFPLPAELTSGQPLGFALDMDQSGW